MRLKNLAELYSVQILRCWIYFCKPNLLHAPDPSCRCAVYSSCKQPSHGSTTTMHAKRQAARWHGTRMATVAICSHADATRDHGFSIPTVQCWSLVHRQPHPLNGTLKPCPSSAQVELHEEEKKLIAQQQVEMQHWQGSSDKPAELVGSNRSCQAHGCLLNWCWVVLLAMNGSCTKQC